MNCTLWIKLQQVSLQYTLNCLLKSQHVTEKWGIFTSFCINKSVNKTYCLLTVYEVSLENVLLDVRELGKGMDLIRRECSLHDHSVLKDFVQATDTQLDKLQKDAKAAEVSNIVLTLKYPLENMKIDMKQHFSPTCSSLTSNRQPIMTPDLTMFTNIASSLALSSLILGSLQQCGELLRRESQDDSTLSVLPCICALYQSLQGEHAKQKQHLCISPHFCVDRVQFSLLVNWEVPWFVSQRRAEFWLPLCHRTWQ